MSGSRPRVRFTGAAEGDLAVGSRDVDARRRAVVDRPWTWLVQEHGAAVVRVTEPGAHAGSVADAAVTSSPGVVLAVQVADCAPVALVAEGAVGVAHAGWRGLQAGVVQAAVEALRGEAPPGAPVRAVVGTCIGPECYEFGADDLADVVARYGPVVASTTAGGAPALDLVAGVRVALAEAGVDAIEVVGGCTACGSGLWSHRARGDRARQAVVAWLE